MAPDPIAPDPFAELQHELRTPLAAIMGMADAMQIQAFGPLEGVYADYARLIHQAGGHMLELIQRTGHDALSPTAFDASEAIAETIALVPRPVSYLASAPVAVIADKLMFRQLLLILFDNAVKFSPPQESIRFSAYADRPDLVFSIMNRAPTQTAERELKGAGLGLDLARRLCQRQGGSLIVRRDLDVTVHVRLPILDPGT